RGLILIRSRYLRPLAESGDQRAHEELIRSAYRGPDMGLPSPIAGIIYLRTIDPDEAFFAASRLFARHDNEDAAELMLQIDAEAAIGILLKRYPNALPSLRAQIARRLRLRIEPERL